MELVRFPSRGGFSVRSIILFCLTVLIAGLLWILLGATPVHAADTDAVWSGDAILFDNHGYTAPATSISGTHNLPEGSTIYLYIPSVNGATANAKTAYFIYFAPGTDPPTATSAQYVAYDYNGTTFSRPHDKKTITLAAKGTEDAYSSCQVSGGLGWIICPATTFLAESMDSLFNILAGMIAVQPLTLQTGQDNGIFTAWNVMRNFANVAFVIAFLVIIYSQITGFGVSNYGLKKLIPRLIVAAVLVNLSFYVSAIAIDASNIIGYSIQDTFNLIREQVFHLTNDNVGSLNQGWTAISAAILSGTGATIGGIYLIAYPESLFLLLPLLLTLILTVFMVVVILAARQALIILLVIVSPLAFVANLLPNTEKLFGKWRGALTTMLVFFPAFSLIFGGSQLAGQLIIQNANGNIIMVLFGMAVQIAPLVITPLILKFSGSTLGKIAQIVNNPKKGLLDRNRNWAKDRSTLGRNRAAGLDLSKKPTTTLGRIRRAAITPGTRMIQNSERRKRALKEGIEVYGQHADNRYKESARHQKLHTNMAGAEMDRDTIANNNNAHIERLKTNERSPLNSRFKALQTSKEGLETAQNDSASYLNRQRLIAGTALNASSVRLEQSKTILKGTDAQVKEYINVQRRTPGTILHQTTVVTEQAELAATKEETAVKAMLEQYKSGDRPADGLLAGAGVVERMVLDAQELTAQTRSVQSAQNRQAEDYANTITVDETGAISDRGNYLLEIAGGLEPNGRGRGRAEATAIQQLDNIETEARKNNKVLLEARADRAGKRVVDYAKELVESTRAAGPASAELLPMIEVAYDALADDGFIEELRAARMDPSVDQAMLTRVIGRNAGSLAAKGGFDLQANYALAGATREQMDVSIASSLGGISADKIASQKFAWWLYLSKEENLGRIISNVQAHTPDAINDKDKTFYESMLKAFHATTTQALTNPTIAATLGGRRDQTIAIHKILQEHFKTPGTVVDYDRARDGS